MKRLFLFQMGNGVAHSWDDAMAVVNMGLTPGLGVNTSNNPESYVSQIEFFEKVDNRFVVAPSSDPQADIVLTKPYTTEGYHSVHKLQMNYIASVMEGTEIAMFATVWDRAKDHNSAIENASFYTREPLYDKDSVIKDMTTGEVLDNPTMIPWFFVYKTKELPVYYVILNPYYIQHSGQFDGWYKDNYIFGVTGHHKNLSEIIFDPQFSRNVRKVGEHNLFIKGNEFTAKPFGTWFVNRHMQEFFDDAKVKVDTNFEYQIVDGVIHLNTNDKKKGYLCVRWNSGTVMDMTFRASNNRFFKEYVIDVID